MTAQARRMLLLALVASFLALLALASTAHAAIPVGDAPYTILTDPVHHEVFVANSYTDNITVIDSTTDSVTGTITVGPPYPGGLSVPVALAYNPNTDKLYCVNFWSEQLLAIDRATKSVEATINVVSGHTSPRAVVVDPLTNLVYFSSLGNNCVYVVDGEPTSGTYNQLIATIGVGLYPRSLAVNTTHKKLYVANTANGRVSVVDIDPLSGTYHTETSQIIVGTEPYALALNHTTDKLYVTNRLTDNVSVIDCITDTVVSTVGVGTYPRAVDVNPETNLIYVANRDSGNVSVIDGSSDTVTRTVTAGVKPYAVAAIRTASGNTYVANYGNTGTYGTVTGIDPSFNASDTTVGVGPCALSIDTLLAKPKVFVANYASDDVSVIDPPAGESSLVTTIDPFPGDTAWNDSTPLITGSSQSVASPIPHKIIKVYWQIDSTDGDWSEAEITGGLGTSSVEWEIQLTDPLAEGAHTIHVVAMDVTGATITSSDGFAAATPSTGDVATYGFVYEVSRPPTNTSISPTSGSGSVDVTTTFTSVYSDPNGASDIAYADLMICQVYPHWNGTVGVMYKRAENKLYLMNDAGNSWGTGYAPGSVTVLENSQVRLDCQSTSVSAVGNNLTVNWRLSFKSSYVGTHNTYMYVKDSAGTGGWDTMGTWTVL